MAFRRLVSTTSLAGKGRVRPSRCLLIDLSDNWSEALQERSTRAFYWAMVLRLVQVSERSRCKLN